MQEPENRQGQHEESLSLGPTNDLKALSTEEARDFAGLLRDATELANVDHLVIEGRMSDEVLFIDTHPTHLRKIIDMVLRGLPPMLSTTG